MSIKLYSSKHFSLELLREKFLKIPWKSQEKFRNLISQKCGHPDVGLFLKIPLQTDTCVIQFIGIFLKLSTKTAEEHLIIGMTLVHSVISIVFKSLAFLRLEF